MFAFGKLDPAFAHFKMFPRQETPLQSAVLDLESGCSLVVEEGSVHFDPETLFANDADVSHKVL